MKIINKLPPIYNKIIKSDLKPNKYTIYTYGDVIYNPNNLNIPDDLIVHESIHSRQQIHNVDEWWNKYLLNKEFRLNQELEAYVAQYRFICMKVKDRNQRNKILLDICNILSSEIYGNIITSSIARKLIINKLK